MAIINSDIDGGGKNGHAWFMDHLVRTIDFISGRFSRDFSAETSIAPFLAARIKINGFLAPIFNGVHPLSNLTSNG